MSEGTLQIQSENILPIIKKWLYTDKEIFLRELISNSCDAIHKAQALEGDSTSSYRIHVTTDAKANTLTITDNGIGMTREEVEKYIAQVAFSGAKEFVEKYQNEEKSGGIIGHFGLGFYSAFMPSSLVTIDTLSKQAENAPTFWSCDGSATYTIETGTRRDPGTSITLHIAEDSKEFLEPSRLREILAKYCRFLPIPIDLNGSQINEQEALWTKSSKECTTKDYQIFYRSLYPFEPDPIFWIHLNVDYPFRLKGILFFPKMQSSFEPSQGKSIHLYCNRVFVSDNCKDFLPDYLTALRGIIDSPDLPLNVSRSNLQMDQTIRQLSSHITKKIADKLLSVLKETPKEFHRIWPDIEIVVKLGILQDPKFYERVSSLLLWKSSTTEWTTLEEYLERNKGKKVLYQDDKNLNSSLASMYRDQGIEILYTTSSLDIPLLSFLEGKRSDLTFQRLDGGIDPSILDNEREKTLLDTQGKTEATKMADATQTLLSDQEISIQAKSLKSDHIHAFLLLDEKSRRVRDYLSLSGKKESSSSFPQKPTFVINTNSSLVQSICQLKEKNPTLAKELMTHLYYLTLLEQKELNADTLPLFLSQSTTVLDKLSKYATTKDLDKQDLSKVAN